MNIIERVTKLETSEKQERKDYITPKTIQELKDRIEKLETIIETMGYYISKRG